jgi:hypothetical protein
MRTTLIIALGVALAAAFDFLAAALSARRVGPRRIDGGGIFIWTWLAFTLVDFVIGVMAGHGALLEVAIHALIFAVPAAVAWFLSRRRSLPRAPPG